MGAEIVIKGNEFKGKLKNGDDFLSNPSEFTTNLTGSVMTQRHSLRTIDIEWLSIATTSSQWNIQNVGGNDYTIKRVTDFTIDRWSVGDTFDFVAFFSTQPFNNIASGFITAINADGTKLFITLTSGSLITAVNYKDDALRGTTPLTALIYNFGLIENQETFNTVSKVSENDQAYYGSDIGFDTGGGVRDTNFVDLIPLAQYRDWVTGTAKARYVQNTGTYIQQFEIVHEFLINPFYVEGELPNLQNNVVPTLLAGLNSLKYVSRPEFRTVLSNPSSAKFQISENNLGSVGWYNENFNGFNNLYNIKDVEYFETATPANSSDGLIVSTPTTARITVERIGGSFLASERFGVAISYLPLATEYQNTLTNQKTNFIYVDAYNQEGAGTVANDFIAGLTATLSGSDLVIDIQVSYSIAQQMRLTATSNYVIGINVADASLSAGNTDEVMLIGDVNNYVKNADIPNLLNVTKFDIYPHNKIIGIDSPVTDLKPAFNEDGVAIDGTLSIALDKDAFINTMELALIAFNTVTENSFDLDTFLFDIAGSVVSSGVQQLIVNSDRGYNLLSTDQNTVVTLSVGSLVGDDQFYNLQIGQKIRWQDWINNLDADTIFFNASKLNDNLNFKSSNYSELNDYEIRLALRFNVFGTNILGQSGNTIYQGLTPKLSIFDYGLDENVTPIWSYVIETWNEADSINLGGVVQSHEDTLMKIIWTNSGGPVTDIVGFYAINRIEVSQDTSNGIFELSSISTIPPPVNNLLKVIPSNLGTKISIIAGNVVAECLIESTLIDDSLDYNLSGTIVDTGAAFGAKTTSPSGIIKTTSPAGTPKTLSP